MDIGRSEIFRSIAEMAYVVARADKGMSAEERIAFHKIIEEELDYEAWAAQSRFDLLDEVIQPSIEKAYNEAMHDFRKYKSYMTEELKEKTLTVMKKVAEACQGLHEQEAFIIDRCQRDLQQL